jgi:uncharacterized protein (DUF1330 family)
MPAYAVGHIRELSMGPDMVKYLKRIDETLKPFEGQFLVHGAKPEVLEGEFPGQLIIIEFPGIKSARAWHESKAYQEILPLRTNHSEGEVIIVDGVAENHRAIDTLRQ